MGFFGSSMLVRADVDVTMLDIVRAAGGTPDAGWTGSGGWRFARLHRGRRLSDGDVRAVAQHVGAAFLAAHIVDSDFTEDSVLRLAAGIGAIPPADLADYTFGSIENNSG